MRTHIGPKKALLFLVLVICGLALPGKANAQSVLSPDFATYISSRIKNNPSAVAGAEIWFFATAFNDRFYTYSYAQRLGGGIDWYRILAAKNRAGPVHGW